MCQLALQQCLLAHHSSSPCFAYFCDFDLILLKFYFIEGSYTIRFFKIHIDCWTRCIWLCLIHLKKKKKITFSKKHQGFQKSCINLQTRGIWPCLIHFQKKNKKKIKIFKNHASIYKLGTFDHASSILKKKKIIFLYWMSLHNKIFQNSHW